MGGVLLAIHSGTSPCILWYVPVPPPSELWFVVAHLWWLFVGFCVVVLASCPGSVVGTVVYWLCIWLLGDRVVSDTLVS